VTKGRRLRVDEFLVGLKEGRAVSLQYALEKLGLSDLGEGRQADVVGRAIGNSTQDQTLAVLHRRASETLLCGDFVFRKGGEPIYVRPIFHYPATYEQHNVLHELSCQIGSSASLIYDFDGRPWRHGDICVVDPMLRSNTMPNYLGYMELKCLKECFCSGATFRADELKSAFSVADPLHHQGPPFLASTIEVLDGIAVDTDPIDLQVEQFVRDLNVRMQYKSLSKEIAEHPSVVPITLKFRDLAYGSQISKEVGAAAIEALELWCTVANVSCQSRFYSLFALSQEAIDAINAHCRRRSVAGLFRLADDDDAALASFDPT
jgi:hypothetical protein